MKKRKLLKELKRNGFRNSGDDFYEKDINDTFFIHIDFGYVGKEVENVRINITGRVPFNFIGLSEDEKKELKFINSYPGLYIDGDDLLNQILVATKDYETYIKNNKRIINRL